MITNFEKVTSHLSKKERILISFLISGLKDQTKEKPIKAPEIIKSINARKADFGLKQDFPEARLRKCINFIRSNGLLFVIATDKGYYSSNDRLEMEKQIKSLRQRADAINKSADGLQTLIQTVK